LAAAQIEVICVPPRVLARWLSDARSCPERKDGSVGQLSRSDVLTDQRFTVAATCYAGSEMVCIVVRGDDEGGLCGGLSG